jgi:acetyl esterase/lipase
MASSVSLDHNPTTKEDVAALATPDPELAEFLSSHPLSPRDYTNLPAMRAARRILEAAALAALGPSPPAVLETQNYITLSDGATSEVLLFQPTAAKEPSALIVLIHGGGFCVGSPSQLTAYGRVLCETYGAVVASVGFRLAPEYKSPTQANDVWDGTQWVVERAESFGADPAKKGFVIGGISAGGNLTAVTVLRTLETPLKYPITGVWLSVPLLLGDDTSLIPEGYRDLHFSLEQNKDAPILNKTTVDAFNNAWGPDFTSTLVTPFASKDPFIKFPRTYFQACGLDPIRDDALVYERILRKAGTETRINVYKGLPHASWAFLPTLKSSGVIVRDTVRGIGWLLGVQEKEVNVGQGKGGGG